MRFLHKDLREIHIVGSDTPEKIILPKISSLMMDLRIGLAGVSDAGSGFEMVRLHPHYGHIVACCSGYGEVWVNGRWQVCRPGMAYLTPPGVPHAYHTLPGVRWEFAWIWSHPSPSGEPPLIDCTTPLLVRADSEYLRSAILGLYRESIGPAQQTVLDHWVELVYSYAARLGRTANKSDPRNLIPLWEKVDSDLAHGWTLSELAEAATVSTEHLRRLCRQQTGRGPMKHVTYLRMRRAAMLLESTRQKIGAIAISVGYDNPFAFSTAFKRHIGSSPAEYRRRRSHQRRRSLRDSVHERLGGGKRPVKIKEGHIPSVARQKTPPPATRRSAASHNPKTPGLRNSPAD
ncbi:MAG TPA: AraC family transcriptional regulator [Tepidisphaeraceae bacterium]|jgi:AraC-like DNA-binding protein|nr:AraC family transcriptional regulator [Tepidisphaeraceae bacterium]